MNALNESQRAQRMIRLLTTLVVLVALLVVGLGAGAALAFREYARMRAAVQHVTGEEQLASLQEKLGRTLDLASELTQRQEALASGLESRANQSLKSLEALKRQREELSAIAKGPIDKMEQMIRINQLMADEMLLLLHHVTLTQASLAEAMRPLPTQREVAPPATGGSGTE
jgi:SMC interacting uncharacterized protein involved in chromosome segregation